MPAILVSGSVISLILDFIYRQFALPCPFYYDQKPFATISVSFVDQMMPYFLLGIYLKEKLANFPFMLVLWMWILFQAKS